MDSFFSCMDSFFSSTSLPVIVYSSESHRRNLQGLHDACSQVFDTLSKQAVSWLRNASRCGDQSPEMSTSAAIRQPNQAMYVCSNIDWQHIDPFRRFVEQRQPRRRRRRNVCCRGHVHWPISFDLCSSP